MTTNGDYVFSENLSLLYRYLRKQVGRPWNKVYSEIRRFVNANGAVHLHILQHLYDRLAVHVWEDSDGHLWHIEGWVVRLASKILGIETCSMFVRAQGSYDGHQNNAFRNQRLSQ